MFSVSHLYGFMWGLVLLFDTLVNRKPSKLALLSLKIWKDSGHIGLYICIYKLKSTKIKEQIIWKILSVYIKGDLFFEIINTWNNHPVLVRTLINMNLSENDTRANLTEENISSEGNLVLWVSFNNSRCIYYFYPSL